MAIFSACLAEFLGEDVALTVTNHLKWEIKKQIGIWRNFSGINGMDIDKTGLGGVPAPFLLEEKQK